MTTDVTGRLQETVGDEVQWAKAFVERVVAECPRRGSTSEDEARAHDIVEAEMRAHGLVVERQRFTFNESFYQALALQFGVGLLGTLFAAKSPLLALLLHAGAGASFYADSTRKAFTLRRLLPFRPSQNVIGTMPAVGKPRRRVVFLAHVDAAYTGVVFDPKLARSASKRGPLARPLQVVAASLAGLSALDLADVLMGRSRLRSLARLAMSIPTAIAFGLNLDVVLRDRVVPGAMDDLSGVASLLLLSRRLATRKPDDVEVVLVATGCEESGLGGSQALVDEKSAVWSRDDTTVIAIDSPANGDLRWYVEGEIVRAPLAPSLEAALRRASASEARFAGVAPFAVPVGGTDAIPFAMSGYDAVGLGCVDPGIGMPRHYHMPHDTPENLEAETIPFCLDYIERLFDEIVKRPGGPLAQ